MKTMMSNPRKLIRTVLAVLVGAFILGFIFFRLSPLLRGPKVIEINLQEVQEQPTYMFTLEATVANTNVAYINGVQATVNQDNIIRKPLVLSPGSNIIELKLGDTFDRERIYTYEVITPPSEELYIPLYNEAVRAQEDEEGEEEGEREEQEEESLATLNAETNEVLSANE